MVSTDDMARRARLEANLTRACFVRLTGGEEGRRTREKAFDEVMNEALEIHTPYGGIVKEFRCATATPHAPIVIKYICPWRFCSGRPPTITSLET